MRDGTVHAVNTGITTWHGFATEIARLLGADIDIAPVTTDEFPRPARRPAYSVLDTTRLEGLIGRPMPSWQDALKRYSRGRMRILITGVTGFVGTHLAAELRAHDQDAEIWGLTWGDYDREASKPPLPASAWSREIWSTGRRSRPILEDARPDLIYHLAAASSVARSWDSAARSLEINAMGTAHLFDAVLESGLDPVVVVSSTAEIYGRIDRHQHTPG